MQSPIDTELLNGSIPGDSDFEGRVVRGGVVVGSVTDLAAGSLSDRGASTALVSDASDRALAVNPTVQPSPVANDVLTSRIVMAATSCIELWGWEKTSVGDIARAANCSRASVYRKFPDGKPQILEAVLESTADNMMIEADKALRSCTNLRDCVVKGIVAAANEFDRVGALKRLVRTDRSSILPLVAFDRIIPLIESYDLHLTERVAEFTPDRSTARSIAGWSMRLLVAYVFAPGEPVFALHSPAVVDRLVGTYLLPGFDDLSGGGSPRSAQTQSIEPNTEIQATHT